MNMSQIRKHFSDLEQATHDDKDSFKHIDCHLEQAADDWVPVELELVDRMWIPDAEILKLKGFRWWPY